MGKSALAVFNKIERDLSISTADMRRIISDFHAEMRKGLSGRPGSLKMIPTYVDRATGSERGEFVALDLGGTNFRVLDLTLKGSGRFTPPRVMKFTLDKRHITGTGKGLFDFLARSVKRFMREKKVKVRLELKMGFTFSFPVEQTGIASGRLLRWTKGFTTTGVIGKDAVRLLNEALARQLIGNVKVTALANDTVGTMVSLSYQERDCDIGVILGTGTNACYREKIAALKKWDGPSTPAGMMIINTEWGNFDRLMRTRYDVQLDRRSTNPGQQVLEKMVSGMYLGELVRLIAKDLIGGHELFGGKFISVFDRPYSFKTEYMSALEADASRGLQRTGRLLRDIGVTSSTPKDRAIIKKVCEMVSLRASRVSASALAALVTRIDPSVSCRHTIAVDGSVYEKHPGFSKNMKAALGELFGERALRLRLKLAKDGSGKGAAIIAALA